MSSRPASVWVYHGGTAWLVLTKVSADFSSPFFSSPTPFWATKAILWLCLFLLPAISVSSAAPRQAQLDSWVSGAPFFKPANKISENWWGSNRRKLPFSQLIHCFYSYTENYFSRTEMKCDTSWKGCETWIKSRMSDVRARSHDDVFKWICKTSIVFRHDNGAWSFKMSSWSF